MNRIQQLLSENRWADAGVLLNRHPTLFQHHPDITLTLGGLEERHLEDLLLTLRPGVCLPSVRLERMNLQRVQSMQQLIGRQGVTKLDLHECDLSAEAWKGLAEGAEQTQRHHQSGLRAFSFCARAARFGDEPDVTTGLSCFLDHSTHLNDLALGRVRFHLGSVFESMKGKVARLTLSHMHAECFDGELGEEIVSPDVKTLRLCHWLLPQGYPSTYPLYSTLDALVRRNFELADIELNSMPGYLGTGHPFGIELANIVAARNAPLTVTLHAQADERLSQFFSPFWTAHSFLNEMGQPPKGHVSKPLLDLHMVWPGHWALPCVCPVAGKLLQQEREMVMAIPSLRSFQLGCSDGSGMSPRIDEPDGTLHAGYVSSWARVLNAQLIAEARAHFMETFSLSHATASLPPELTPALLDLPARPRASIKTPDLHSVTLLNRESYNTWVDSVEKARAELPPPSSRFVPELTRLPTDNG